MVTEPASELLRHDRILDFDEFRRAQEVYGVKRRRKIVAFRKRIQLFPITLTFRSVATIGLISCVLVLGVYGLLSTCVTNKQYELMDQKKALKNLGLSFTEQKLVNEEKIESLRLDEKKASALGLAPPAKRTYIVRTNIPLRKTRARFVKDLYPLSEEIIAIEP